MSGKQVILGFCAAGALVCLSSIAVGSEAAEGNCAVIALTVYLRLWGQEVPVSVAAEELRRWERNSEGVSLAALERAARRWQRTAHVRRASLRELRHLPMPVLVHGVLPGAGQGRRKRRGHYVVLLRIDRRNAVIADPLTFQVAAVPVRRFARFYDGYALLKKENNWSWLALFVCFSTLAVVMALISDLWRMHRFQVHGLALVLLVGALVGCGSRGPEPFAPAVLDPERIALEASPAYLDMGTVPAGQRVSKAVRLRNVGSRPLRLRIDVPGCAKCTAELTRREVPPGGISELRVSVAADRVPAGAFYRTIRISSVDGTGSLTVEVFAVVEGLLIKPYTFRCTSTAATPPPLKGTLVVADEAGLQTASMPEVELEDLLSKRAPEYEPCLVVSGKATWGAWQKTDLPTPYYEREFTVPLAWNPQASCVPRQVIARVRCMVRGKPVRRESLLRVVPSTTTSARPAGVQAQQSGR